MNGPLLDVILPTLITTFIMLGIPWLLYGDGYKDDQDDAFRPCRHCGYDIPRTHTKNDMCIYCGNTDT